jgi:putative DNA primase/helicase
MVRFLKQFCGYSLTGDTSEHAPLFVFGPGGNGKSVFLNVLIGILGTYAKTATMDAFIASKTDRHTTEIAMLNGARVVTVSETEEGRQWAESRIKQLTGGDPISAHFMRQDNFTFRPQFKLAIVGNHMPSLQTVDEAHRRRFNLVPFTNKPAKPDRELEQKLKAEWPAILRWAIEGCLDWQVHRLVRPPSVVQATNEYFDDQDLFGQWLADERDVEPGNPHKWERVAKLYDSWSAYANLAGEKPKTKKAFSAELQKKGYAREPLAKARGFSGIRLKLQNGNDG